MEFDIKDFDTKKSAFIEASAGTGKTYTIQQIVAKLLFEGLQLDKILLVTYTEKAAGELKDRIRKKILEVIETGNLNKDDSLKIANSQIAASQIEKFKDELEKIQNAPIFTIHSFCNSTLKEFSFLAKVPQSLSLIGNSELDSFLDKYIRDEFPKIEYFRKNVNSFKNDEIKNAIKRAFEKYYLDSNGNENAEIISLEKEDEIKNLLKATKIEDFFVIDGFKENYETLKNYVDNIPSTETENSILKYKEFLSEIENLSDLNEKLNSLFNGHIFQEKKFDSKAFAFETFNNFKDIKKSLKNKKENYDKSVFFQEFLTENLEKIFLSWQKEKDERKIQTFTDMLTKVHEAICEENSPLKNALREKYSVAIIDEFQDTNQLQWDIFEKIFLVNDGIHRIFVVGDPKQSIFSFQGTDLNVYKNATEKISNSYSLVKNYRSTNSIINACNSLFKNDFFSKESLVTFSDSKLPENPKPEAEFFDEKSNRFTNEIKPILLSSEKIDKNSYAENVVKFIKKACYFTSQKDENGNEKTYLQVFKKVKDKNGNEIEKLQNVSFGDFAILARTRTEFPPIENELKKAGIPFTRYKDTNLFADKECADWIAILNAIDVSDFTGRNRNVLSEALYTRFFNIELENVKDEKYDNITCNERRWLSQWKFIAFERKWSALIENILESTKLEESLSNLKELQTFTKYRQIGNYIVSYLYKNKCSIGDVVNQLKNLSLNGLEDDNIVAKGTDFDCVKLITIHSSKGLEYPVVISVAGFKGEIPKTITPKAFNFHKDKKSILSFYETAREAQTIESRYEYQRLFYVAFTRVQSLLILPHYEFKIDFLKSVFESFRKNNTDSYSNLKDFILDDEAAWNQKNSVNEILSKNNNEKKAIDISDNQESQRKVLDDFIKTINSKITKKHSYSSLSKGLDNEEDSVSNDLTKTTNHDDESDSILNENIDSEDDFNNKNEENEILKENFAKEFTKKIDFDRIGIQIPCDYKTKIQKSEEKDTYPRGNYLGNAIHEIFERIDFTEAKCSFDDFSQNEEIAALIKECFEKQSLYISKDDKKNWLNRTKLIVWNTLNGKFPEIIGSKTTNDSFKLSSIDFEHRIQEAEFNFTPDEIWSKKYLMGFIDLLFAREINGTLVYSIIDWKSDYMNEIDLTKKEKIKDKIDEEYSIQRVLYSYILIKWLKNFYFDLTETEIFEKYFGGIYYILVRGCENDNGNGIYAHTWNSWNDLQESFELIKKNLIV